MTLKKRSTLLIFLNAKKIEEILSVSTQFDGAFVTLVDGVKCAIFTHLGISLPRYRLPARVFDLLPKKTGNKSKTRALYTT